MSFCDFLISESKKGSRILLKILKDTYVECALGYIKSYLYEYSNEH